MDYHSYEQTDIGNYWDEYTCKHCKHTLVMDGEIPYIVEQLNKLITKFPCIKIDL